MPETTYVIPANLAGMREHYAPGIFAVSVRNPDERCSANPADYFWLNDGFLKDSAGEIMILAREESRIVCPSPYGGECDYSTL